MYYITDRKQFPGTQAQQREQLIAKITEAARAGVDYIQLREKDLSARDLEVLASQVVRAVPTSGHTRLLINSRTDIALSTASDGVNLRSQDISPSEVRRIWRAANSRSEPVVAVSCHAEEEVRSASSAGADFVVFGPVFGKGEAPGTGLAALKAACGHKIPVLALGGVTLENAGLCLARGAAGVAGIRLFQQGDLENTVQRLRQ